MASIPGTIEINLKVKFSLWDAIKLRIAGKDNIIKKAKKP